MLMSFHLEPHHEHFSKFTPVHFTGPTAEAARTFAQEVSTAIGRPVVLVEDGGRLRSVQRTTFEPQMRSDGITVL